MNQSMYLVTKLTQPRTSRWHLPRPHLHSILADGLTHRLTALIAAAGHGKTCTLAYFLTEAQTPYLWIQLAQVSREQVDIRPLETEKG